MISVQWINWNNKVAALLVNKKLSKSKQTTWTKVPKSNNPQIEKAIEYRFREHKREFKERLRRNKKKTENQNS